MIKCRRAILEYAEAKIIIVDMGYGPIVQAFDHEGAPLIQDTARVNKKLKFIKDMCQVADLDQFDELISFLKGTGYLLKSQEEQLNVKPNEEFHPSFKVEGIPN